MEFNVDLCGLIIVNDVDGWFGQKIFRFPMKQNPQNIIRLFCCFSFGNFVLIKSLGKEKLLIN